ncbi:hypothetical protein [Panacibacter microcysteis]|uniref:hypothetical protein n=1 Tax=Panacibacter microcysteis TaxID=2793269 RepID=UPI001E64BA92|nr:hypothetical protein [Panacibacter microcysteis]
MSNNTNSIFDDMLAGGIISNNDPRMPAMWEYVYCALKLVPVLNTSTDINDTRTQLSNITGREIDNSTVIFVPFYTNFGRHIKLGRRVLLITHALFSILAA